MSASVTTSVDLMPSSDFRAARMRSRMSARLTPASPTSAAAISMRRTPASTQARSAASRTAFAESLTPTRRGLEGPASPSPRILCRASTTTARVFVPPPSTPSRYVCAPGGAVRLACSLTGWRLAFIRDWGVGSRLAALAELAELAGAEHGRIRVGSASAGVSSDALPAILKKLRKSHPHVEVSVASGTSEELVKRILAGELDMAFVSLPVQARNIETELMSEDQLVAIASPRHRLAKQRVVSAFALAGEKLILGERGGNTRRLIDEFFAEAGLKPTVAMELSRQAAIKNMVAADMGVGIVPLSAACDEVERGRLGRWGVEGARINWEVGVARLSGGYLSPICRSVPPLCRQHFASERRAEDNGRAPAATE